MLIKAGTYRFNDVLSAPSEEFEQDLSFTVNVSARGYDVFCQCTRIIYNIWSHGTDDIQFTVVSMTPNLGFELPTDSYVYSANEEYGEWDTDSYGAGIQTITIPNDTEVSAEFYEWFTANAKPVVASIHYNGSTIASLFGGDTATVKLKGDGVQVVPDIVVEVAEVIGGGTVEVDKSEAWFAENFPSDTWSEGEYTGAIEGVSVKMRYKYRTGKTDPKDIAFDGAYELCADYGGTTYAITNLAEFYLVSYFSNGRMWASTNNADGTIGAIMLYNPVVPVYFDVSEVVTAWFAEYFGIDYIDLSLSATLCFVKNTEGENSYMFTGVTYSPSSSLESAYGGWTPKIVYALASSWLYREWFYEVYYAYGGRDTALLYDRGWDNSTLPTE